MPATRRARCESSCGVLKSRAEAREWCLTLALWEAEADASPEVRFLANMVKPHFYEKYTN